MIVFTKGIILVGNALAGEYFKWRVPYYNTKWEQINVGDEKDHVIAVSEYKGIYSNMEGKSFGDGFFGHSVGLYDISPKTEPIGNGYVTLTDKDGNKIYLKWDQKGFSGGWSFYKGTGKFEGIQGKGTWSWTPTPDAAYSLCEVRGEVELP